MPCLQYLCEKLEKMELQTIVKINKPAFQIDYTTPVMMLGSCFVENMGGKIKYFRFPVDINPCGIVYNPLGVSGTLSLMLQGKHFEKSDLLQNGGQWVSLSHHGSFSDSEAESCLKKINCRLEESACFLKKAKVLVITWGTSWVYRHKLTGLVVANCHKFPAADFERFRLRIEEIVREYTVLFEELFAANPGIKILFTVSPIRHWKDGAHENQLSKSVLLLAIEELINKFHQVSYFPSYEIVMDELRDYRFYADDMLHISSSGINYIWTKFLETYMTPVTRDLMSRVDKLNKVLLHKPLDEKDRAHEERKQEAVRTLRQLGLGLENVDSHS